MSKAIGLNIVLGNSVLTLILPEDVARNLVESYLSKSFAQEQVVGGRTIDGQSWAIKPMEAKGMSTFDYEALRKQQEAAQAGQSFYGTSQGHIGQRLSGI